MPLLALSYSGGAPSGFSGPEDYCNACHGSPSDNPVNTGTGSVTITAQGTFAPGETVPITVTVDNTTPPEGPSARQGFMISARIPDSGTPLEHVGDFDLQGSTLVQYGVGGSPDTDAWWVTHTASSNQMDSWTFAWTAPDDAPPVVVLYAVGNATNGNFIPDANDKVYATSHTLTRQGVAVEPEAVPQTTTLNAPYPNPFRDRATATYSLAQPDEVHAVIRDGLGRTMRVVEAGSKSAGTHTLDLRADGLAAGTYFLSLTTRSGTQTQALQVVR